MGIYSTINCSDVNWSRKGIFLKNIKGRVIMFVEKEMQMIIHIFSPADL